MSDDHTEYVQVWQTWTMLRPPGPKQDAPPDAKVQICEPSFRAKAQKMRINKRLSVVDLAAQIRCDACALAAFERGETILPRDANSRLLRMVDAWEA